MLVSRETPESKSYLNLEEIPTRTYDGFQLNQAEYEAIEATLLLITHSDKMLKDALN